MTALPGRAAMAVVVDDGCLHVCTLSGLLNPCRGGDIEPFPRPHILDRGGRRDRRPAAEDRSEGKNLGYHPASIATPGACRHGGAPIRRARMPAPPLVPN